MRNHACLEVVRPGEVWNGCHCAELIESTQLLNIKHNCYSSCYALDETGCMPDSFTQESFYSNSKLRTNETKRQAFQMLIVFLSTGIAGV